MSFRFTVSSSLLVLAVAVASMLSLGACSAIIDADVASLPDLNDAGGPVIDRDLGPRDGGPAIDGGPIVDVDLGVVVPCTGGTRCMGGELIECVGGAERRTRCELGCPAGAPTRCAEFVASNVPADSVPAGTEDLEVGDGELVDIDTDACAVAGIATHVVPQPGGLPMCVVALRNLRVRAGGVLSASGSRPLVVLAAGDIEVVGSIDVSAQQGRPGAGGGAGGLGDMLNGEGIANGTAGVHVDSFDDGGGGGGGLCGGGGAGGLGGTAAGGPGGAAVPTELTPLVGGSGGGRGRGTTLSTSSLAGYGGAGGGAVQLSAFGTLRLAGVVRAGGGGGGGGAAATFGGANWGSGGGAGSGGAVLFEAARVEVTTGARVVVAGGGGGGAAAAGRSGANGGDGTAVPASVGGAGGAPGAAGGDGALRVRDGESGDSNAVPTANGGGGGGGSGCIVARTASGTLSGAAALSTPPGVLRTLPALRR